MKLILVKSVAVLTLAASAAQTPSPTPPDQPSAGPGGRAYLHESVKTSRIGSGAEEVYLFEPAEPTPRRTPDACWSPPSTPPSGVA